MKWKNEEVIQSNALYTDPDGAIESVRIKRVIIII